MSAGALEGRVALVTGAAGDLGRGIAAALAARGATVACADVRPTGPVAAALTPGAGVAVALDVTDSRAVDRVLTELVDEHGRLDVLEANLPGNPARPGATTFHLMANPAIDVDGDHATATVMGVLLRREPGDEPGIAVTGHYEDVLVRERGRWRFRRREAFVDVGRPIE